MKTTLKPTKEKAQWDTIEALESIANQCIYKGKDVAKARAVLKSLYQRDIDYENIDQCLDNENSMHENPGERRDEWSD